MRAEPSVIALDLCTDDLHHTPTIAVALSGGADSMALTLLAYDWAAQHGTQIVTLTVDHQLRPDSRTEAEQVGRWMQARGIPHHILTPPHTAAGNNLMQAARTWRYDALAAFCHTHGILQCLLGHHADDQLETVALAHLRGRATLDLTTERSDGEAGMRGMREYHGIQFVRPMLHLTKPMLIDYLTTRQVAWIEDPTNADPRFARARVRAQLAEDPALKTALAATLATRRAARATRDAALADAEPHCLHHDLQGRSLLNIHHWQMLEPELRSLLLANLVRRVGGKPHRPRRHETERLTEALLTLPTGKRTLGHCLIQWKKGTATLQPQPLRTNTARIVPS